jgi:subtilisin family serine protease
MRLVLKGLLFGVWLLLCQAAMGQSRIICRYVPGTNLDEIARSYHIQYLDRTPQAPFVLYACVPNRRYQCMEELRKDPGIVWAEEDGKVSIPEAVGQKGGTLPVIGGRTTLYQRNAGMLQQVGWSSTLAFSSGRTVSIAILDTGVSPNQPDLWSKVVASANYVETGPAYDVPLSEDTNANGLPDEAVGHGTMVAGVADQIAPEVDLVIARVADSDGFATAWSLTKGLAFAVNSGSEVANISLGTLTHIQALDKAIDWCAERNLLVVAAIGNDGTNKAAYPAKISKVICVGGLMPDNTKAPFSNWDKTCDASAPATGIYSQTWTGQIGLWSGTSFAAPMVSASIADCLRRSGPVNWSSWQGYLRSSGVTLDLLNPEFKDRLGTGLNIVGLNAAAADGGR